MRSSDFVATSTEELHDRIDAAHHRFVALVGSVAEPGAVDAEAWSTHDVVAHVVNVVNRYNEFDPSRLAPDPRGVDVVNARELALLADRPTVDLIGDLADEMQTFRDKWGPKAGISLDTPLPFHGGASIDFQSGLTNLLGELLMHGLDVARTSNVPWEIDDRDGALLCAFGTQILPYYVRSTNEHDLVVQFELDGVSPWTLDVRGAHADVRPRQHDERSDIVVRGPALPVALLFYARATVAGGEHPERLARLGELFEAP
jgi:hypothetical protein